MTANSKKRMWTAVEFRNLAHANFACATGLEWVDAFILRHANATAQSLLRAMLKDSDSRSYLWWSLYAMVEAPARQTLSMDQVITAELFAEHQQTWGIINYETFNEDINKRFLKYLLIYFGEVLPEELVDCRRPAYPRRRLASRV